MHLPPHSRGITICISTYILLFKLLHHTVIEQCCVLQLCQFDFMSLAAACSGYTA